jgi:uncharacterized protein (UPF0262 family)
MKNFRLDRSAFKIQSHKDADTQQAYWLSKTPEERIAAAWYLICAAYDLDYGRQHRLDRNAFRIKKRAG